MTAWLVLLTLLSPTERPIAEMELMGQCEVEHVAVYASGVAHFDVSNSCGTSPEDFRSGLRQVSSGELRKLRSVIAGAKFESLPESIEPDPGIVSTEDDVYTLRVWRESVAKQVRAFGLERAVNQDAARRFQMVWAALEQLGPEGK